MTARMYRIVENRTPEQNKVLAGLRGQAKVVADDLLAHPEARLGVDIDASCGKKLVTKQDTLRVVLYYVVILKGKGLVEAVEPAKAAPEVDAWDLAQV